MPLAEAINYGGTGCTPENPCGVGEGDCDSDNDCFGELKCFQKESDASIPGIDTESLLAVGIPAHDWCYDPSWHGLMTAYNMGGNGCTSSSPCGVG
jgi:hypothetical protein